MLVVKRAYPPLFQASCSASCRLFVRLVKIERKAIILCAAPTLRLRLGFGRVLVCALSAEAGDRQDAGINPAEARDTASTALQWTDQYWDRGRIPLGHTYGPAVPQAKRDVT